MTTTAQSDTQTRVDIQEVDSPTILARQAIGVFDSGTGGMVAAAYLSRMLRDSGEPLSVVFFGDTANLPYGKKTQEHVAQLSDAIIARLAPLCPVIGIACNTASASWARFGKVGKSRGWPRVFSVVEVAGELAYERARTVREPKASAGARSSACWAPSSPRISSRMPRGSSSATAPPSAARSATSCRSCPMRSPPTASPRNFPIR